MLSFSLTQKAVIDPILAIRSRVTPGHSTWHTIMSEIVVRVIAVFASVFAAADALIHFAAGTYKGILLLARSICCLNSRSNHKYAVYAHFRRTIWFIGLAVVGSFAGVVRPDLFEHCRHPREHFSDSIAGDLAGFNNSEIWGQINGIYITTNETNLTQTRQLLETQARSNAQTIHIGCAGWHNFDIMSLRGSNYGLIIDFNPKNAVFMKKSIEMINSCESRDSFKCAMVGYLNSLQGKERDLVFHRDLRELPTERIERELLREGSWLQTEESFLHIKMLVSLDRIIPITEDITNCENFAALRRFLDSNNLHLDTLYLSNICNFMNSSSDRKAFEQSVKQLLNKDTVFINCPKISYSDGTQVILSQRAILGEQVLGDAWNPMQLFEEIAFK